MPFQAVIFQALSVQPFQPMTKTHQTLIFLVQDTCRAGQRRLPPKAMPLFYHIVSRRTETDSRRKHRAESSTEQLQRVRQ